MDQIVQISWTKTRIIFKAALKPKLSTEMPFSFIDMKFMNENGIARSITDLRAIKSFSEDFFI